MADLFSGLTILGSFAAIVGTVVLTKRTIDLHKETHYFLEEKRDFEEKKDLWRKNTIERAKQLIQASDREEVLVGLEILFGLPDPRSFEAIPRLSDLISEGGQTGVLASRALGRLEGALPEEFLRFEVAQAESRAGVSGS